MTKKKTEEGEKLINQESHPSRIKIPGNMNLLGIVGARIVWEGWG